MNDQQFLKFSQLTATGAQIATMLAVKETRPTGAVLAKILFRQLRDEFPNEVAAASVEVAGEQAAAKDKDIKRYHALWRVLHRRGLSRPTIEPAEREWLARFEASIPCSVCQEFYRNYLQAHPPRFDDYFAWTVELHNAVNLKLGKPELALEAARLLYVK